MKAELNIRNREMLIGLGSDGNSLDYIYFWSHRGIEGQIDKSCLSQWYESNFVVDNKSYKTAEHFMMAEKARLFNDSTALKKILGAMAPDEAKKIGKTVKNFDENVWTENRFEIVVRANLAKFKQNEKLREFLLGTDHRILVEASPFDRIWGVGLAEDDPAIKHPTDWRGLNLLGFALMEVRQRL